jgi:hypothetical protein
MAKVEDEVTTSLKWSEPLLPDHSQSQRPKP